MRGSNKYTQLIPERILDNISSIEISIKPKIKGYSSDYLREVISIISYLVRKDGKPVQVQIEYIKKLVPQGDKYLTGLRELNIIVRSGHYIPGESSYKYIFARKYQSRYISVLLSDQKLIRRIHQARISRLNENSKLLKGHSEQTKCLESLTITDGWSEFIHTNFSVDTRRFNLAQSSATRILNGNISYSVDNTSCRFHSNITYMLKGLRSFLRINGEPLANIDIKNSQPYLSTLLLTNPSKVSGLTKNPDFARLLQTLKVSTSPDVEKYIDLAISGQIYEFLMDEFLKEGLELPEDSEKRRTAVKKQVLRILFAPNRMPLDETNRKAREIFSNRFPSVHEVFSLVRGHERVKDKNDKKAKFRNFKRFAILLQRIESHLILEVIIKRIYKELPGVIAVTIHDSIMTGTITDRINEISKIMTEELTCYVGYQPRIKVER